MLGKLNTLMKFSIFSHIPYPFISQSGRSQVALQTKGCNPLGTLLNTNKQTATQTYLDTTNRWEKIYGILLAQNIPSEN